MDVELEDFANWRDCGKDLLNRVHGKGKRGILMIRHMGISAARVAFWWEVRLTILAVLWLSFFLILIVVSSSLRERDSWVPLITVDILKWSDFFLSPT